MTIVKQLKLLPTELMFCSSVQFRKKVKIFRRDYFEEETKYMVAMIAEDEANNKSPVSNIQEVFIPSTASTTPTSTTPTTSKIPCPEGWIDASYMDLGWS